MVAMVSHGMMDNLSCMLLAKDEFQANMQGRSAASGNMQAQLDSELARENSLLRQQLLEAAADNDAISKSLQERVRSLADTTDAKTRAETEGKMLQVQVKSLQKDLDVHKYELHLLRKQLQIRNEEKEHHKKASDASYQRHLENVKKIARLESECQRLRGLIRQRLPGPAAVAQMRAECDMHVRMGIKKKPLSVTASSPSKSHQAQREIESLKDRLLSVEDEAKFLKEAMTKRTAELQEARQLCARTAMKLSAAQDLMETMTSPTNTVFSTPSTPARPKGGLPLYHSDHHLHALPNQEMVMLRSSDSNGESNGENAPSTLGGDVDDTILDVNSLLIKASSNDTDGELDELRHAESWASALFAELSHLSNHHEETLSTTIGSLANPEADETSRNKTKNVILNAYSQELELNSAIELVHEKLSSVGETLLTSFTTQANSFNVEEEDNERDGLCDSATADEYTTSSTCNDRNREILEEILQIKGLLMKVNRAMKISNGSTNKDSFGYDMNDNALSYNNGEEIVKQEGQKLALKGGKGLSRLRCNSLEDEFDVSAKIGEGDESEHMATKFSEHTGEMEDMCTNFSEESVKIGDISTGFSENNDEMEMRAPLCSTFGDEIVMGTKFSEMDSSIIENSADLDDGLVKNSTKFSDIANEAATAASGQLNLAPIANDEAAVEESASASELDPDVELQRLLHLAQADLELAHGRITTLEAELAHCMQEKADVANELSDTRSLKQSLEADLACAVASVEELKLQLSSLQALTPHGNLSPKQGGSSTVSHIDMDTNVKEEQELAAARAQLADCQRSIHVIRKQIAIEMQDQSLQDVINDDQVPCDTSSESSKSVDQSSHSPSPISDNLSFFSVPSSNTSTMKVMEDIVTQQGCSAPCLPSHTSQEDEDSQTFGLIHGHAPKQQIQQNIEQCKGHDNGIKINSLMCLTRSFNKDHSIKAPQNFSKITKSSTTSRISEFFNRAKSATRVSEL